MNTCYIIGAAEGCARVSPEAGDIVIAADGGYARLEGVRPDLVVGDFDSLGYVPEGENVVRHPVRKDDTDTMLAARLGLERGFRSFVLTGVLGGRLDHTLANIQTLAFLDANGASGRLTDGKFCVALINGGELDFPEPGMGLVSVFAYGGNAEGVTLTGLEYPLKDALLTPEFPLGVSNRFTGVPARIAVKRGRLLVVWEECVSTILG